MTEVDWVLLGRYAAGDCTNEEREQVEERLTRSPHYRSGLEAIRRVAVQSRNTMPIEERAERLARLRDRISATAETPRRGISRVVLAVAAILLVVCGSLVGYIRFRKTSTPVGISNTMERTITTTAGERMSLHLADGTLVVLGPLSTLRIPITYPARARAVALEGEAEFLVSHNTRWPFTVRTARLVARDLGTRFLVRAYAGDSVTDVVVTEGSVQVLSSSATDVDPADGAVLLEAQRARLTSEGRLTLEKNIALDPYFTWTEGRVVFHKTPLREVVLQVERWRDIDIDLVISARRGAAPFIGVFQGSTSTVDVVQTIAMMCDLQMKQTGPRSFILHAP